MLTVLNSGQLNNKIVNGDKIVNDLTLGGYIKITDKLYSTDLSINVPNSSIFLNNGITLTSNKNIFIGSIKPLYIEDTGRIGIGTSSPDSGHDITANGNVLITGNLDVAGTVNYTSTTEIQLADSSIKLNTNQTTYPTVNSDIEIERGTYANAIIRWDELNDFWSLSNPDASATSANQYRIVDVNYGDSRYVNVTGDTVTGNITMTKNNGIFTFNETSSTTGNSGIAFRTETSEGCTILHEVSDAKIISPGQAIIINGSGIATHLQIDGQFFANGQLVWNAGNDGDGSGLDADLLHGMSVTAINTASTIVSRDTLGNFNANIITASLIGNSSTATRLSIAKSITINGDADGTITFDGSDNVILPLVLSTITAAGTYKSVTVDTKGRVTSGTNPTTLSLYGITDAAPLSHVTSTGSSHTYINQAVLSTSSPTFVTVTAALSGNATTSTKLSTPRTINGVNFDGSSPIIITADPNAHTHLITDLPAYPTTLPASSASSLVITTGLGFTPYNATNPSNYINSGGAPVQTVSGRAGTVVLTSTDVGLANVNNTSDVNKPVSTIQLVALNLKADLITPTFTGIPKSPTAAVNVNTTQIATTAFVLGQVGTATPLMNGTSAVGVSYLYSRQDHVHLSDTLKANLENPSFTGVVTSPSFVGPLSGNASSSNKLNTPRLINGVSFDGSSDINITAATSGGNSDTVGGFYPSDFAPSGFGLGTTAQNISNTDLNTPFNTGFFRGSIMTNAPDSGWFYIINIQHGGWTYQEAIAFGNDGGNNLVIGGTRYSRVLDNTTWRPWKQVATTADIPTTSFVHGDEAHNNIYAARVFFPVGKQTFTITHSKNWTNYIVQITPDNPETHFYYSNKTATTITINLDDPVYDPIGINVDIILTKVQTINAFTATV